MNDDEKLLWLFTQVHGNMSSNITLDIPMRESGEEPTVYVMKGSSICWTASRSELTFQYITKHL